MLGLALVGCGRLDFDPLSEGTCAVTLSGPATVTFNSSGALVADGGMCAHVGQRPSWAGGFGYTVHQNRRYVVGGCSDADNVMSSDDGITWNVVGHLPMDNHGGTLVSASNKLFYTGGHNGSLFD